MKEVYQKIYLRKDGFLIKTIGKDKHYKIIISRFVQGDFKQVKMKAKLDLELINQVMGIE